MKVPLSKLQREKALKGVPKFLLYPLAWFVRGKPPRCLIQPALFAHLRSRGMAVMFLGVNSEKDLRLAVTTGATAVLTDKISYLTELLSKRKELEFKVPE
jgi:hypothetical protein